MTGKFSHIDDNELQSPILEQTKTDDDSFEQEKHLDENADNYFQLERLKTLKENNNTLAQNNQERKKYARWIFTLTCCWTLMIFLIIFLRGFNKMVLSDTVLITLITSTTLNFFGFFFLVVKYLFNPLNKVGKLPTIH